MKSIDKEKNFNDNDKLIYLITDNEIKKSETFIKLLNKRIQILQEELVDLLNNKPLFFKKAKKLEYNKKIRDIENEINKCYIAINEEFNMIVKLNNK